MKKNTNQQLDRASALRILAELNGGQRDRKSGVMFQGLIDRIGEIAGERLGATQGHLSGTMKVAKAERKVAKEVAYTAVIQSAEARILARVGMTEEDLEEEIRKVTGTDVAPEDVHVATADESQQVR